MNAMRFDSLARAVSDSRRGALRTLLGGTVGMLLAGLGAKNATAGCKGAGKKCDKNKDCCDGAKCQGDKNGKKGKKDKKGKCRCKSGLTDCPGEKACSNLDDDIGHCGACDNACAAGDVCCNGACVDPDSDRANCGGCDISCGPVQACSAGVCVICQPTTPLCGDSCCGLESCCGGVCVDLKTSRVNCGACFTICDFDETCINGVCKGPPA